jgi:hypothetical protein
MPLEAVRLGLAPLKQIAKSFLRRCERLESELLPADARLVHEPAFSGPSAMPAG